MHARQTCRNTDELTYGRNQSAKYGRGSAVLAEIFLGCFYLFAVDETHVSYTTVCKAVDDGASYPLGEIEGKGMKELSMAMKSMTTQ